MIGYLVGEALSERIVQTPGGVGYVVSCVEPLVAGQEVALHVTTVVREDAITCYGFQTELEQVVFEAVMNVPRVGPKLALALLRDVGVAQIALSLREEQPKVLAGASGVGAKLAGQIIAARPLSETLIARLLAELGEEAVAEVEERVSIPAAVTELVATLEGLGYDHSKALAAGQTAHARVGAGDDKALMRAALEVLTGRG